jgi:hypothetical protein
MKNTLSPSDCALINYDKFISMLNESHDFDNLMKVIDELKKANNLLQLLNQTIMECLEV